MIDNMEKKPKLVSVIVPVYNSESYLAETIESILTQTYKTFELIIVDDGSTDRSQEIIRSYPQINYVYQENQGVAAARNRGIQMAKGFYLTFLDADDIWYPEKLKFQITAFESDPKLEIVTGYVEQFVSPEIDVQTAKKYAIPNRPLVGYSASAIMIKRATLKKTGLFHEDYQGGEAISWFANMLEQDLKMLVLPEIIARRRIHGKNLSIQLKQNKETTIAKILKESLDRRRAKNPEKGNLQMNGRHENNDRTS